MLPVILYTNPCLYRLQRTAIIPIQWVLFTTSLTICYGLHIIFLYLCCLRLDTKDEDNTSDSGIIQEISCKPITLSLAGGNSVTLIALAEAETMEGVDEYQLFNVSLMDVACSDTD